MRRRSLALRRTGGGWPWKVLFVFLVLLLVGALVYAFAARKRGALPTAVCDVTLKSVAYDARTGEVKVSYQAVAPSGYVLLCSGEEWTGDVPEGYRGFRCEEGIGLERGSRPPPSSSQSVRVGAHLATIQGVVTAAPGEQALRPLTVPDTAYRLVEGQRLYVLRWTGGKGADHRLWFEVKAFDLDEWEREMEEDFDRETEGMRREDR